MARCISKDIVIRVRNLAARDEKAIQLNLVQYLVVIVKTIRQIIRFRVDLAKIAHLKATTFYIDQIFFGLLDQCIDRPLVFRISIALPACC
ncbi:hypothetical protein GY26_13245 [Gammaproteobacteria bacterium MFB021]|nr:hypothetical protein GY26_13245 [Gammaproteobacteria bacterium MFB021]